MDELQKPLWLMKCLFVHHKVSNAENRPATFAGSAVHLLVHRLSGSRRSLAGIDERCCGSRDANKLIFMLSGGAARTHNAGVGGSSPPVATIESIAYTSF